MCTWGYISQKFDLETFCWVCKVLTKENRHIVYLVHKGHLSFLPYVPGVFTWMTLFLCLNISMVDIDMWSFVLLSWHQLILFDIKYIMIKSMVAEIVPFFSRVAGSCNWEMTIESSTIVLNPWYLILMLTNYCMHLYSIFVILITLLDVTVWISLMSPKW